MNEFIVWDNNSKVFIDFWELNASLIGMLNKDELLPFIGKKDIEGTKIYADCSIFEFREGRNETYKGYFYYDTTMLRFRIKTLDRYSSKIIDYTWTQIFDIKIIDTIQENKLGLIKKGD